MLSEKVPGLPFGLFLISVTIANFPQTILSQKKSKVRHERSPKFVTKKSKICHKNVQNVSKNWPENGDQKWGKNDPKMGPPVPNAHRQALNKPNSMVCFIFSTNFTIRNNFWENHFLRLPLLTIPHIFSSHFVGPILTKQIFALLAACFCACVFVRCSSWPNVVLGTWNSWYFALNAHFSTERQVLELYRKTTKKYPFPPLASVASEGIKVVKLIPRASVPKIKMGWNLHKNITPPHKWRT